MTRTIDTPTLEGALVRHCSPTLAALKPASLFTFPGNFTEGTHGARNRAALRDAVDTCADQLAPATIAIRVLAWRACGALVYVYRPQALEAYLRDPRATKTLARLGYDTASLENSLRMLGEQLRSMREPKRTRTRTDSSACPCTKRGCSSGFPHELGFFLGYPYEDVMGFIEHHGRDYLAAGPWKVYANLEGALATFERFRRCAAAYARAHQQGCRLAQLAVSPTR